MPQPECLNDETLVDLLAGKLTGDAVSVHEEHLRGCHHCVQRAGSLETRDRLTESLRAKDTVVDDADGDDVGDLIHRLRRLDLRFTADDDDAPGIDVRSLLQPPEEPDEIGRFGGHRVLEFLGQGGMGIVFKAEDPRLQRIVALKVMNPILAASRLASRRFQREARATAAFEHDHVVTIYQVGEDQGLPFFTMQLLDGESLQDRLQRQGPLDSAELLRISREVADGLAAAHERGLLHRDIKPDNIWLQSPGDRVCIVDFGIAHLDDGESRLTQMGTVMGTPDYMAPEQARGEEVDERCDLFSLGSVLYRAATGELPFSRGNPMATLMAVSESTPQPPSQLNPDLPIGFEELILKLLAKQPESRFASAHEVTSAIERIRELHPDTLAEHHPTRTYRRRILVSSALTAVVTVLLGFVIQWSTNHGTLIVESDDEGITVAFEKEKLVLTDRDTGRKVEVTVGENRLRPGDYLITAKDQQSKFEFSAKELNIHRGRNRMLRISWKRDEPSQPAVTSTAANAQTRESQSAKKSKTPSWLVSDEQVSTIKPGDPVSPLALVQQPAKLDGLLSWTIETRDHRSFVNDVALRPDGQVLATAGNDGTIRLWDVTTGKQQRILVGHATAVGHLAWSPDGTHLASSGQEDPNGSAAGEIRIWQIADSCKRVRSLNRSAQHLSWSPDGRLLAFSQDGVHFWDLETGNVLPNFGVAGEITRRAWSPDSRLIATSSSSDGIRIWNVKDRALIHTVAGQDLHSPHWLSDRNYLAWLKGSKDRPDWAVEIWDIDRLHRVKTIKLNPASKATSGRSFSWSPGGEHLVMEMGRTLTVWDVAAGQPIAALEHTAGPSYGHRWASPKYSWAAGGRVLSAMHKGHASVADLDAANPQWRPIAGLEPPIRIVENWMRQNTLATLSTVRNSRRIDFWDLSNLQHLQRLKSDAGRFPQYRLSPDGSVVATNRVTDPKINPEEDIYDRDDVQTELTFMKLVDGQVISRIPLTGSAFLIMHWSPDGRRVALQGNRSTETHVVDIEHGQILYAREQPNSSPAASSTGDRLPYVFSPDSRWLAWPGQKTIEVLNSDSGEVKWSLLQEDVKDKRPSNYGGFSPKIHALAWSPDGKWLAASVATYKLPSRGSRKFSQNSRIQVWEWSDGDLSLAQTHQVADSQPRQLYFSPDSSKIAWRVSLRAAPSSRGKDRDRITVLDLATGETKGSKLTGTRVRTVAWLNGETFLFADDHPNRSLFGTWNTNTGEIKTRVHKTPFRQIFRTHDQSIAVGDFNQFQFWKDMKTWRSTLIVLSRDVQPVLVLVTPDGSFRTSSPKSHPLRFVAITTEGDQQLLSPDEFQQRFNWKPGPVQSPEL